MRFAILILFLLPASWMHAQTFYTISGFVTESGSKEQLPGVIVYAEGSSFATSTNGYGFYSLKVPADSVRLVFSYVGFQKQVMQLFISGNTVMNVDMTSSAKLKDVVITSDKEEKQSESARMSTIQIPVSQIKEIPALFGEKDVLKVIQLMPGVQKSGEGNTGIYVRGGGPDQNLIILDEAPVYNASHLFGFFSIFNGDALKSVEFTKGGFPARYGGRLSSVIDMRLKEGNKEKFHGEGGIGIIASRLTLEGPIKKGKSSFLVSARRTYIDMLIKPFLPPEEKAGYFFYDLNAKFNYEFSQKNKIYLSGYFGSDKFYFISKDADFSSRGGLRWGNITGTLRWNHVYSGRVFSNTSFIYSRYRFNIYAEETSGGNEFNLDYFSGIRDWTLKHDFDIFINQKHKLKTGLQVTYHYFTPKAFVIKDNSSTGNNIDKKQKEDAFESGIYIEDEWHPISRLRFNGGFRLSAFQVQGKSYVRPEPRISGSYMLSDVLSVKASYAGMNQYIHLLSNTGIGLPTDLWVPSTAKVVPQSSKQWAAGLTRDFLKKNFTVSLEGYYKIMDHIIGYKEGASFLDAEDFNDDPQTTREHTWEKNITQGKGWSYGAEFLLQKKQGKLSGWIGYTLSWTQLQFDALNFGKKYYAKYDRRHDISVVGIYKITENVSFSSTWVFGTGNAVTLPLASYAAQPHLPGGGTTYSTQVSDYGNKNSFRMAPYHRLDFAFRFTKVKKWGERTWELGVYNAYNRWNPFYYFSAYDGARNGYVLKQASLFGLIPSLTYNFKF